MIGWEKTQSRFSDGSTSLFCEVLAVSNRPAGFLGSSEERAKPKSAPATVRRRQLRSEFKEADQMLSTVIQSWTFRRQFAEFLQA